MSAFNFSTNKSSTTTKSKTTNGGGFFTKYTTDDSYKKQVDSERTKKIQQEEQAKAAKKLNNSLTVRSNHNANDSAKVTSQKINTIPETTSPSYTGAGNLGGLKPGKGVSPTPSTAKVVLGGLAKGLTDIASNTNALQKLAQPNTGGFKAPVMQDQINKGTSNVANAINKFSKLDKQTNVQKAIGSFAESVPGMAMNFIPGVGLGLGAANAAGEAAKQGQEAGVSTSKQLENVIAKAATNYAFNFVPVNKLAGNIEGKLLPGLLKQSGAQGAANVGMGVANRTSDKAFIDKNTNILNPKLIASDALQGALFGAITEGAGKLANGVANKNVEPSTTGEKFINNPNGKLQPKLKATDISKASATEEPLSALSSESKMNNPDGKLSPNTKPVSSKKSLDDYKESNTTINQQKLYDIEVKPKNNGSGDYWSVKSDKMEVNGYLPKDGQPPYIYNLWHNVEHSTEIDKIPQDILRKGTATKHVLSFMKFLNDKGIKQFSVRDMSDEAQLFMKGMERKGYLKEVGTHNYNGDIVKDPVYEITTDFSKENQSPSNDKIKSKVIHNLSEEELNKKVDVINTDNLNTYNLNDYQNTVKDINALSRNTIRGVYHNKDQNINIKLTRNGIGETLVKMVNNAKLETMPALPELIKNAVKYSEGPDTKGRNIDKWIYLVSAMKHNGVMYRALMDVKYSNKEHQFHLHKVEIAKVLDNPQATQRKSAYDTGLSSSTSNLSLKHLLDDVNVPNSKENINNSTLIPGEKIKKPTLTKDDIIKTNYSKVNDPEVLRNHINELEKIVEEEKKTPLMNNLQLFAKKLEDAKKQLESISRFRTNTIERTTMIPEKVKSMINPQEFDFIPESSKEWQANAVDAVNKDYAGVVDRLENATSISGGQQAHEAAVIAMKLKSEAEKTGDYSQFISWLKMVATKTRETARALKGTDTAWEKGGSDGAIMKAAREVDKADEELGKTNPKLKDKVDTETKKVKQSLEQGQKEAAEQAIEELTPEELLAKKVSSTLNEGKSREANPIMDMVNELFKSAKESPLPEKEASVRRNPIEYLRQAIQNKGEYTDVWNKAKDILKVKYADNPEALSTLDDYFNKGIVPTYSEKTLNSSIQVSMKDLQQKLVDIAKSSKGDKEKALKNLTDYLVTNTGATEKDAQLLAYKIKFRFDELVKEKSSSILNQMFKTTPKRAQKSLLQKVDELINLGAYNDNAIRDLIKQKEGLPVLTSSDVKYITEHMDKAKTLPENSYERKYELALVREIIESKAYASSHDKRLSKLNSIQTLGMLSAPKTAVRNTVSNLLFRGIENTKDVIRTGIDKGVSTATKERTATLPNLKAQASGFKKGLNEAVLDFKNNVDTRNINGDKMELTKNVWDKNGNLFNKTMNNISRYEKLVLTDRPFEGAAFADEFARQKKLAEINGKPFDEVKALEKAKYEAAYATFQEDSALSKMAIGMKRALNKGKPWGAGDIILKFTKTPANLTSRAIEYTPPVALAKALKAALNKSKGFNQEVFVNELAKGLTGTGVVALGLALNQMGVITSSKEDNANISALNKSVGTGNYILNLSAINRFLRGGKTEMQPGDLITSYDWASPTSVLLTLGSELGKSKSKDIAGKGGDVLESLMSGINGLVDQPMTKGLQALFGSHNISDAAMGYISDIPQSFVPAILNNIRQFDNQQKETYDPNIFRQGLNKAMNRIPGANSLLLNKVDTSGNNQKVMQNNNPVNIFLNPANTTQYLPDAVQGEVLRLYKATGNTDIIPRAVDKTIKDMKLSTKEYTDLQRETGKQTEIIFSKLMKNSRYKAMTDENKAKVLGSAMTAVYQDAKDKVLKSRGISTENKLTYTQKQANKSYQKTKTSLLKGVGLK